MLAFNPSTGEFSFVFNASASAGVTSVNGRSGAVTLVSADVGLGNCNNTSDANKPVSTPTAAALATKADLVGGVVPTAQIPAIAISDFLGTVANQVAMLALTGQKGDWAIRSDTGSTWIITGADPTQLSSWTSLSYPAAPVTSVNGHTGSVTLIYSDVGAAGVAFANVFTTDQTIDMGSISNAIVDGLVMRNDTMGTNAVPLQNSPVIVFEAHGFDGAVDHKWEMNEQFFTYASGNKSKFLWQFYENEGASSGEVYLDSSGSIGATGYITAGSGFGFVSGPGLFNENVVSLNSASASIGNGNLTVPLRFQSGNSTVTAWRFNASSALSSGNFIEGLVPDTGFTGSYLKLGRSSNGSTITTTMFDLTAAGNLLLSGQLLTRAGTTGAGTAPIKLVSGSLNTTAEAGAIEFLTDGLYFTITTGAARKAVPLGPGAGPITFAGPTAARTVTLPDANFTVAKIDAPTFTNGIAINGSGWGGVISNLAQGSDWIGFTGDPAQGGSTYAFLTSVSQGTSFNAPTGTLDFRIANASVDPFMRMYSGGGLYFGTVAGIANPGANNASFGNNLLIGLTTAAASAAKAVCIANGTAPSGNIGGVTIWAEGGALKMRGGTGTVTILGPA